MSQHNLNPWLSWESDEAATFGLYSADGGIRVTSDDLRVFAEFLSRAVLKEAPSVPDVYERTLRLLEKAAGL